MSLYNAIFGKNPIAPLLLKMLGIDQPDGKWSSGRFRDAWLNEDGTEIHVYTRNGGGNREHWNDEAKEGIKCHCTGCTIEYQLPRHPNYIKDFDDDFDCTYATVVFSTPKKYLKHTKKLASKDVKSGDKVWTEFFDDMDKGKNTEQVQKAIEVGRKIFGKIKKGEKVILVKEEDSEPNNKSN